VTSSARLVSSGDAGDSRIQSARATAPQRWALSRPRKDGWNEVVHQLLGDGVFGGDSHRTAIVAGESSRLVVRGIAPTALRGGLASSMVTRIEVRTRASLLYFPGALVPHTGSNHATSLRIDVEVGGSALVATVMTPGRTGMGERGAFEYLRLRTAISVGREFCLSEDASLKGAVLAGAGGFGSASAYLSIVAVGASVASRPEWWSQLESPAPIAVSSLRCGGIACRALFGTLGEAQQFLEQVEGAVRGCTWTNPAMLPSDQAAGR